MCNKCAMNFGKLHYKGRLLTVYQNSLLEKDSLQQVTKQLSTENETFLTLLSVEDIENLFTNYR